MTTMLSPLPPVTADQEDDEAWRRTLHARVRAYLEPIPVRLGQPDTFDLVVTPWVPESELLRQAVHAMQQPHGCGPVLADPDHAQLYWAVPPGTAATWAYPFTACHGRGTVHLPAPACHQGPGLHWLSPWKRTHLVAPRVLMAALADLPRAVAVHAAEAAQAAAQAASAPPPGPRGDIAAFFRPAPHTAAEGPVDPPGDTGSVPDRSPLHPPASARRDHGAQAGPSEPTPIRPPGGEAPAANHTVEPTPRAVQAEAVTQQAACS